jgi:LuxR family maltose regulon positive regulatory protein
MRNHIPTLAAYAVLACLLSRRGDLDEAAAAVERASAQLPRVTRTSWWLMIEARILLAPALVALGRRAEATTRLDEAEALLQTHPDAGQLPDWYRETLRTLRLQHGRRPPPSGELSEAELRVLHLLNNDLTLAEIGRELYLSRNTVKSHLHSIYRKLGVSSRSDVARAMKVDARSLAAGA